MIRYIKTTKPACISYCFILVYLGYENSFVGKFLGYENFGWNITGVQSLNEILIFLPPSSRALLMTSLLSLQKESFMSIVTVNVCVEIYPFCFQNA